MNTTYTIEKAKEIASDCTSRSEFEDKHQYACKIARTMGWMDILFPVVRRRTTSLTLEKCIEIAKGCVTRLDLEKKNRNCLEVARENGWLPLLGLLEPDEARTRAGKKRQKYTEEELIALAKQYDNPSDFKRDYPKEYAVCLYRGLHKTFTWFRHFDIFGDIDHVYVYEWPEQNVAYVGRTINKLKRVRDHLMEGDPVYEYAKSAGVEVPEPIYLYSNVSIFDGARLEKENISKYKENGWDLINSNNGGGLGSLGVGYSKMECIEIASGFEYVQDLKKDAPSIYAKLLKHKWLKLCTWLKYKKAKNGTYSNISEEEGFEIAKKFKTRSELCDQYDALYRKANKEGWLDKWFPPSRMLNKYTMDGQLVGSYVSMLSGARSVGKNTTTCIASHLLGRLKHAYGFIWKWTEVKEGA